MIDLFHDFPDVTGDNLFKVLNIRRIDGSRLHYP